MFATHLLALLSWVPSAMAQAQASYEACYDFTQKSLTSHDGTLKAEISPSTLFGSGVSGDADGAVFLSQENSWLSLPLSSRFKDAPEWTLAMWVKPTVVSPGTRRSLLSAGSRNTQLYDITLRGAPPEGHLPLYGRRPNYPFWADRLVWDTGHVEPDNGDWDETQQTGRLWRDQWAFVTIRFNESVGLSVHIANMTYTGLQVVAEYSLAVQRMTTDVVRLLLGAPYKPTGEGSAAAANYSLQGYYDSVRMYTRRLDDTEVMALRSEDCSGTPHVVSTQAVLPPTLACYDFEGTLSSSGGALSNSAFDLKLNESETSCAPLYGTGVTNATSSALDTPLTPTNCSDHHGMQTSISQLFVDNSITYATITLWVKIQAVDTSTMTLRIGRDQYLLPTDFLEEDVFPAAYNRWIYIVVRMYTWEFVWSTVLIPTPTSLNSNLSSIQQYHASRETLRVIPDSDQYLYIGNFEGLVDSLRIYPEALSLEEAWASRDVDCRGTRAAVTVGEGSTPARSEEHVLCYDFDDKSLRPTSLNNSLPALPPLHSSLDNTSLLDFTSDGDGLFRTGVALRSAHVCTDVVLDTEPLLRHNPGERKPTEVSITMWMRWQNGIQCGHQWRRTHLLPLDPSPAPIRSAVVKHTEGRADRDKWVYVSLRGDALNRRRWTLQVESDVVTSVTAKTIQEAFSIVSCDSCVVDIDLVRVYAVYLSDEALALERGKGDCHGRALDNTSLVEPTPRSKEMKACYDFNRNTLASGNGTTGVSLVPSRTPVNFAKNHTSDEVALNVSTNDNYSQTQFFEIPLDDTLLGHKLEPIAGEVTMMQWVYTRKQPVRQVGQRMNLSALALFDVGHKFTNTDSRYFTENSRYMYFTDAMTLSRVFVNRLRSETKWLADKWSFWVLRGNLSANNWTLHFMHPNSTNNGKRILNYFATAPMEVRRTQREDGSFAVRSPLPLRIGTWSAGLESDTARFNGFYFPPLVDNIKVFGSLLTDEEVMAKATSDCTGRVFHSTESPSTESPSPDESGSTEITLSPEPASSKKSLSTVAIVGIVFGAAGGAALTALVIGCLCRLYCKTNKRSYSKNAYPVAKTPHTVDSGPQNRQQNDELYRVRGQYSDLQARYADLERENQQLKAQNYSLKSAPKHSYPPAGLYTPQRVHTPYGATMYQTQPSNDLLGIRPDTPPTNSDLLGIGDANEFEV